MRSSLDISLIKKTLSLTLSIILSVSVKDGIGSYFSYLYSVRSLGNNPRN